MVLYDSVTFSTTQNIGLSSPIEPEIWYPFWPNRKTNKVQICHFQIGTVNIITLIILLEPVWRKKIGTLSLNVFSDPSSTRIISLLSITLYVVVMIAPL